VLLNLADISGDRRQMTANAKTLGRGRTISPNWPKSSSEKSNCRSYWISWSAARFFCFVEVKWFMAPAGSIRFFIPLTGCLTP
jgi:hypothetical protein